MSVGACTAHVHVYTCVLVCEWQLGACWVTEEYTAVLTWRNSGSSRQNVARKEAGRLRWPLDRQGVLSPAGGPPLSLCGPVVGVSAELLRVPLVLREGGETVHQTPPHV